MKVLTCGLCLLGALTGSGCVNDRPAPELQGPSELVIGPQSCAPLQGVYRITYAKRNGDCADLPAQLAKFQDDTTMSALSSACEGTVQTSDDACDREEDGVCAVLDSAGIRIGDAHLNAVFTQTSEIRIEGSATISLTTFAGAACTANYALIGDKIE